MRTNILLLLLTGSGNAQFGFGNFGNQPGMAVQMNNQQPQPNMGFGDMGFGNMGFGNGGLQMTGGQQQGLS